MIWTHLLSPDLTLNSSASYTLIRLGGGFGTQSVLATAVGLQYTLSASTSLSARYAFFDRIAPQPVGTVYENTLLLGFTKQF